MWYDNSAENSRFQGDRGVVVPVETFSAMLPSNYDWFLRFCLSFCKKVLNDD